MIFIDLGLISFEHALLKQRKGVSRIARHQQPESVYLLEHPPVFTVGRRGSRDHLLALFAHKGKRIEVIPTNRGGQITYHGPGQLVGYPLLDLRSRGRDVHVYLRRLEESLIETVAQFSIPAFQRPGLTGVWTSRGKLASIGIGVCRWVTMHGFGLNVNTDLRYFQLINPCGMVDCPMTSLQKLLGGRVDMDEVKEIFQQQFQVVFGPPVSPTE